MPFARQGTGKGMADQRAYAGYIDKSRQKSIRRDKEILFVSA